jgi:dihydroorotate dehydrogenase (NAD+) catalytic subunit
VRAIALAQTLEVARAVRIPIIGMGGIATGEHALQFLAAGAATIAVGTESFRDPEAGTRVARELSEALAKSGFSNPAEAVGSAHGSKSGEKNPANPALLAGRRTQPAG